MSKKAQSPVERVGAVDPEKVREAIRSTGFNLEFQVSEQFRKAGWGVINNKHYVDDTQGSVREIDLIAYKVENVGHVKVYTSLIVSCKKSEERVWALLSKELRRNDPNIDWHPQHVWSNEPKLNPMLTKTTWVPSYIEACKKRGVYSDLISADRHIFAFQEVSKATYACQNDTNMFGSISSLMKAQGYEMSALRVRTPSDRPSVYLFGLISLADTEIIRIDYSADGSTKAREIDDDRYIGSYIINQKQMTARIHFIRAKAFAKILPKYNELHQCNAEVVAELIEKFYVGLLEDEERAKLVDEAFHDAVAFVLNRTISKVTKKWNSGEYKARKYSPSGSVVVHGASGSDVAILSASEEAKMAVSKALAAHYQYQGHWVFQEEIPF